MMHQILKVTDIGLEELLQRLVRKYGAAVTRLPITGVYNWVRSSSKLLSAFNSHLLGLELQGA